MYAGLRSGELRALRWRHVDLAASRITVCASMSEKRETTDPKSKVGTRRVPSSLHLRKQLVALRAVSDGAPDAYVFGQTPDTAFARTTIYKGARAAWKAARVEPARLPRSRGHAVG